MPCQVILCFGVIQFKQLLRNGCCKFQVDMLVCGLSGNTFFILKLGSYNHLRVNEIRNWKINMNQPSLWAKQLRTTLVEKARNLFCLFFEELYGTNCSSGPNGGASVVLGNKVSGSWEHLNFHHIELFFLVLSSTGGGCSLPTSYPSTGHQSWKMSPLKRIGWSWDPILTEPQLFWEEEKFRTKVPKLIRWVSTQRSRHLEAVTRTFPVSILSWYQILVRSFRSHLSNEITPA